jgi:hypothetical protein
LLTAFKQYKYWDITVAQLWRFVAGLSLERHVFFLGWSMWVLWRIEWHLKGFLAANFHSFLSVSFFQCSIIIFNWSNIDATQS